MSRGRVTAGRRPKVNKSQAPFGEVTRENHLPKRRTLWLSRAKRALDTPDGAAAMGIRGNPEVQTVAQKEAEFWEQPRENRGVTEPGPPRK